MSAVAHADATDYGNAHNAQVALIERIVNDTHTVTLARVVSVTNAGGVSPVGRVDVLPLVKQVTGAGEAIDHKTLHDLPYLRVQGGANAVILDPEVSDIGVVVVCSRDISKVKNTKDAAAPDSRRTYSLSDGVYLGGILNGKPAQYVRFSSDGMELVSPKHVTLTAPKISLNGDVDSTGNFTNNGVNISSTHRHPDPQGGSTGTPQ